jgi:hypothetical protein
VEEFLTVVVLKHDVASYLFTLLVLFPVFLTFVYLSSSLLARLPFKEPSRELAHLFIFGVLGLMIEWFLIGLSPWSNPGANPVLMLLFQLGMFSFWATVAFAPLLFITAGELSKRIRRGILRFYVPYFAVVYIVTLAVPAQARFPITISLIIFGYLFLNLFYVRYFRGLLAQSS